MNPVSFYLLTDTHYFEKSLGCEGEAFESYMRKEQYFMKESSLIVESTFARLCNDKETDIVIIPGDLSKNGEKESHLGFIKELYKLRENGKKVFVITAGHDYNEYSFAYKDDERIRVEGTDFNELCSMYRDFGYGEALAVDEQTHSYIAEITAGVRMLAICCDSPGQPKGAVDDRLMVWLKEQIDKARQDNCSVFAICHYPVIPSVPVFDLVGDAKVKNWRNFASFLADNGVELILTGHMHIQSINEFYSENGNRLIDICTSCLVGSPAKYRKITVDENSVMKVESIDVEDFGVEMNGLSVRKYFHCKFEEAILSRIRTALDGGKGIEKLFRSLARKCFDNITVGTLGRLLFIKTDKSFADKKVSELIGETGVGIFLGDGPHVEGTPVYNMVSALLDRFSFVIKKAEMKLGKDGTAIDLKKMLLNTIGNNKGFSDNNAQFTLK